MKIRLTHRAPLALFALGFCSVSAAVDQNHINPAYVGEQYVAEDPLTVEIEPSYRSSSVQALKDISVNDFVLNKVRLVGVTAFSQKDLSNTFADMISKSVSKKDLATIISRLNNKYHAAGYSLSQTYMPPQDFANGVLELHVREVKVKSVSVSGVDVSNNEIAQHYIENIKSSMPLKEEELMQNLTLLDDIPGFLLNNIDYSYDSAGNLIVKIRAKKDVANAYVFASNGISRSYGDAYAIVGGNYNYTNHALSVGGFVSTSTEPRLLKIGQLEASKYINSHGTKVSASYQLLRGKPKFFGSDVAFNSRGVKSSFDSFYVDVMHPITRSPDHNLFVGVAAKAQRNTVTQTSGTQLVYLDRVRALTAKLFYEKTDQLICTLANNNLSLEFTKGFTGLGAHSNPDAGSAFSRAGAKTSFAKIEGLYERYQELHYDFYGLFGAKGQYSLDELLSSEEFAFGSEYNFGRGYSTNVVAGDHGLAGYVELGKKVKSSMRYIDSHKVFAFYDIGAVWNKNAAQRTTGSRDSASSAGLGLAFDFYKDYGFLTVMYGKPLTRKNEKGNNKGKIYFALSLFA